MRQLSAVMVKVINQKLARFMRQKGYCCSMKRSDANPEKKEYRNAPERDQACKMLLCRFPEGTNGVFTSVWRCPKIA